MTFRVFYLTLHPTNQPSGTALFKLTDPEMARLVFPSPKESLSKLELQTRFDGLISAARALDVDVVVANPPEEYREMFELSMAAAGLIVVYEDHQILKDGTLFKVGYRLASVVPGSPPTPKLENLYDDWINTVYSKLTEQNLVKVVDPWQTYLHQKLREMYQPPLH